MIETLKKHERFVELEYKVRRLKSELASGKSKYSDEVMKFIIEEQEREMRGVECSVKETMKEFWKGLHEAICTTLKEEIPEIQTCEIYPTIRKELLAPAVFVELSSLEPGKDPGTEEFALRARFEARVVVDGTVEDSSIVVRSLAAEVARVVSKNTWNVKNIAPGEFLSAGGDDFRPELDAYLVWMVEWVNETHVGKSVWSETGAYYRDR